ncbi:MAG TPA: LysR family transcriptional regulator [Albitalea sp.]|uniref:LysR family transcriptional regulator n=1 Tax=Piscinibacter sp. TaxID=1903157 RepID=UPI002ED031FC
MDRLQSMLVFKQVVAENGFAAGARRLGLSPARVTRAVQELEDHLGVQLLQRTTRRLALTAAGETYLDRVRSILSDLDAAEEAAHSHAREMSGSVRVLSLPGLPTHLVAPAIAGFRRQHPKVTVELRSDVLASRDIEGHDITLLMDQAHLPADAVVRRIVDSHAILCASPDYVRRHGAPRTPQDLREHALVRLVTPGVTSAPLRLIDEADGCREEVVHVHPVLTCNDHEAALRGTLEGAGISSQAMQVAAPLLSSGQLQRVLSPWICERFTLVATFATRRHMPARIRAFLDHLLEHSRQAKADIDTRAFS